MQKEEKNIKSEELTISRKTGEDISPLEKEGPTHISTLDSETEDKIDTAGEESGETRKLTPFEISRTQYYESEKKKNEAKIVVLNILKYLIPAFIGLLTIFGVIWAYKLNNIAEPIGGIKVEIEHLKEDNKTLKLNIEKLEDRLNGFLEKNLK